MSESGYAAEMQVRNNVKMIYSRMQTLLNRRSKQKRTLEIVRPPPVHSLFSLQLSALESSS